MRFPSNSGGAIGSAPSVPALGYAGIAAFVLLSLAYIFASNESDRVVVIPAVVLLNCLGIFLIVLSLPGFRVPVFEIGSMFGVVVTMYGVIPLSQYQLRNGIYGISSDNRLWVSQPTAEEVGMIGWAHVVFFLAFAVAYLLVRRGSEFEIRMVEDVGNKQMMFAGIFLAVAIVVQIGIEIVFDLSYTTYVESYLVAAKLPQSLKQIYGHLPGVIFTLKLIIFGGIFLKAKNPVRIIALWLGLELGLLLFRMGWRTYFMLSATATILFFHAFIRRVSAIALLGIGVAILGVFLLLGAVRNTGLEEALVESGFWEQSNEMEAVFANALDLMQQKSRNMIDLPTEAQISELTAFIPQQFLPFQKFDYAQWYARLNYETEGYTSAFGTIAQSLAGFGWWELLLRGLLTGVLFGGLHRYFARNSHRWLHCVAYAWLIVTSYQSFRATSLQPFVVFYLEALPVFLVMHFIPRPEFETKVLRLGG